MVKSTSIALPGSNRNDRPSALNFLISPTHELLVYSSFTLEEYQSTKVTHVITRTVTKSLHSVQARYPTRKEFQPLESQVTTESRKSRCSRSREEKPPGQELREVGRTQSSDRVPAFDRTEPGRAASLVGPIRDVIKRAVEEG